MLDELTEVAQNKDRRLSTPEQVRWADAPQTSAGPSSSTSGRSSRASSASSGSAAGGAAAVAGSAPGVPKLVLPAVLELDASSGEDDGSRDFEEDEDVIEQVTALWDARFEVQRLSGTVENYHMIELHFKDLMDKLANRATELIQGIMDQLAESIYSRVAELCAGWKACAAKLRKTVEDEVELAG